MDMLSLFRKILASWVGMEERKAMPALLSVLDACNQEERSTSTVRV
jgi:hypothetical protein